MTDQYWERVAAVAAQMQDAAAAGDRGGDAELVARLTLTTAAEAGYAPPAVDVGAAVVPSSSRPVPIRQYRPHLTAERRPLFVWCHGGAFLGGDLDMPEADAVAREIALRADAVVLSVDYRLCVDGVHFPAPSDDLVTVIDWASRNSGSLGIDPDRMTIGGASAGACLTAGVALRLRDAGAIRPAAVVLAYPLVHAALPPAAEELAEKLSGLPSSMTFPPEVVEPIMENYLGAPAATATPYATAGSAADLSGLPPTLIINCEYDELRASGERFAEQLKRSGVAVEQQLAPDVTHGHLNRPGLDQAQTSLSHIATWVARAGVETLVED